MFGDGDDDLFDLDPDLSDLYPDIDGDGKSTIMDYLLWEDIYEDEEKEHSADELDDSDDNDDLFDDPDEDNDIPDDFDHGTESDDNYNESDNIFDMDRGDYSVNTTVHDDPHNTTSDYYDQSASYSFTISLSFPQKRKRFIKKHDIENTSGQEYSEGVEIRKAAAKKVLDDISNGCFKGDRFDEKRCRFITYSDAVAAKYLTVDGKFLYTQAVKDNFRLPFAIPDETEDVKIKFVSLLRDLFEIDTVFAFEVWEWCFKTFQPYFKHAKKNKNHLTNSVMESNDFRSDFYSLIADHMLGRPDFIDMLIRKSPEPPSNLEYLVVAALDMELPLIARDIMKNAFDNESVHVGEKSYYIARCIRLCEYHDVAAMQLFKDHVFPIVYAEKDKRFTKEIEGWIDDINDCLTSLN